MKDNQTDPNEYFLLTAVREDPLPMPFLSDPDRSHGLNLPDPPELFGMQLVNTLFRLFDRGDIIAQEMRWYRDPSGRACSECIGDPFTPTRAEIERGLAHELLLYYQLTLQGGARWEVAAEADWDRYVLSLESTDPNEWEVTATTRETAKRYMERFLFDNPFPDEDRVPIPETIRWEVLKPWKATYWKTLPIGYRMTCALQTVKMLQSESFEDVTGRIQHWTKDREFCLRDRWFRLPDPAEPPHSFIDQFRRP